MCVTQRQAVSENDQRLRRSYLDKLGRPILPGSSPNTASAAATGEFISNDDERHPLLTLENLGAPQHIYLPRNEKLIRSGLYTLCSFISFLLMLVIMVRVLQPPPQWDMTLADLASPYKDL